MTRIVIPTQVPYEVIIEEGALEKAGALAGEIFLPGKVALVTDDVVDRLYGDLVARSFEESGNTMCRFTFSHGEASKNLRTFEQVLAFFAEAALTRTDLIVALGGGVVGDLVGFAAASYLRGVDFIQIPTTFLAAIDSSVGGKTGVNLSAGKNLCGAFKQPRRVIVDSHAFATLSPETFASGTAEAIKYGVIADAQLFARIKEGITLDSIDEVIARCVETKRDFVEADELDFGQRKLLNLGHTFGHAIEACSNYEITHGHAVATGMVMAATVAQKLKLCSEECTLAIREALVANKLPLMTSYPAEELVAVMMHDKKRTGDTIGLVLPQEIGRCVIYEVPVSELLALVASATERQ